MSKYITRVQLKNANPADYRQLDIEMEKQLFIKVIPAGKEDQTGAREYNYRGLSSIQDVITAAYKTAARIGKQYSLTVIREKRVVTA